MEGSGAAESAKPEKVPVDPPAEWPMRLLQRVHPRRGHPLPPPAVTAPAAFHQLHKAWPRQMQTLRLLPEPHRSRAVAMDRQMQTSPGGPAPMPRDPALQAAAFLALRLRTPAEHRTERDPASRHLIDYWVQGAGLRFAVQTLCQALLGDAESREPLRKLWRGSVSGFVRWGTGGFDRLRSYLAAADGGEHAALVEVVEPWRARFGLEQRVLLSYLFPGRADWLEQCWDAGVENFAVERFYFFSLETLGQLERMAPERYLGRLLGPKKEADILPTLAHVLGSDGAPVFSGWLRRLCAAGSRDAESIREVAEILSVLPHDAAASTLLTGLEDADISDGLGQFLERFPIRGLRVLAPILSGRGAAARRAVMLAKGVVRSNPLAVAALDAAGRGQIEGALRASPLPAAWDRIPEVLRDPPWDRRPTLDGAAPKEIDPDPLLVLPKRLPSLPAFADPATLPLPTLRQAMALPVEASRSLLLMLAFSSPRDPYPGLAQVREACDLHSLELFVEGLFDAWLMAGGDPKQKWAFFALAHFGGDRAARRLGPLIEEWSKKNAYARAVLGLEVLGLLGTDLALMWLHAIAVRSSQGLQRAARDAISRAASDRGLTAEQLEDRAVPSLGLGSDGSLVLDYGERHFTVGFDRQLKPFVVDEKGKKRKTLPKPGLRDDAAQAAASYRIFKALKQDARKVAERQTQHLEVAMCSGRRWSAEDFGTLLVGHPLLVHLVRRLLWGIYGANGPGNFGPTAFRVDTDGTYADIHGDLFQLPVGARVGLVHRLDLDEASAAAWRDKWIDDGISSPFQQLDRAVFRPTESEGRRLLLTRFDGIELPAGRLLDLERRGWHKGEAVDGGLYWNLSRPFGEGIHEVVLSFRPGISIGDPTGSGSTVLKSVVVARTDIRQDKPAMILGELPPRVFSEVVRDLEELRSPR